MERLLFGGVACAPIPPAPPVPPTAAAPLVLLPLAEVERRVGRKKTWIYSRPDFPRPVKVGRDNRWPEHEIQAYIQRLMDARPT